MLLAFVFPAWTARAGFTHGGSLPEAWPGGSQLQQHAATIQGALTLTECLGHTLGCPSGNGVQAFGFLTSPVGSSLQPRLRNMFLEKYDTRNNVIQLGLCVGRYNWEDSARDT